MSRLPHKIYQQFRGKMTKLADPLGNTFADKEGKVHNASERTNFVIQWKGMDWSGFRSLAECEEQFHELEAKEGDHFTVVEK